VSVSKSSKKQNDREFPFTRTRFALDELKAIRQTASFALEADAVCGQSSERPGLDLIALVVF